MNDFLKIIEGGFFEDERGRIDFVNEFLMTETKRFYMSENKNLLEFRGWNGHKIEKRWFYCVSGKVEINLVKIDNWENPSKDLQATKYILDSLNPKILYVPNGYANGFLSLEAKSKLLIFSDYALGEVSDGYKFDNNYWRK